MGARSCQVKRRMNPLGRGLASSGSKTYSLGGGRASLGWGGAHSLDVPGVGGAPSRHYASTIMMPTGSEGGTQDDVYDSSQVNVKDT